MVRRIFTKKKDLWGKLVITAYNAFITTKKAPRFSPEGFSTQTNSPSYQIPKADETIEAGLIACEAVMK